MKKKIISSILSLAMLLSLLPVSAFAASTPATDIANNNAVATDESGTEKVVLANYNLSLEKAPWDSAKLEITKVTPASNTTPKTVELKLTVDGLQKHKNANNQDGYWVGIGVPFANDRTTAIYNDFGSANANDYENKGYASNGENPVNGYVDTQWLERQIVTVDGKKYADRYWNVADQKEGFIVVRDPAQNDGDPTYTIYKITFAVTHQDITNVKAVLVKDKSSHQAAINLGNPNITEDALGAWDSTRPDSTVMADTDLPWVVVSYGRAKAGTVTFTLQRKGTNDSWTDVGTAITSEAQAANENAWAAIPLASFTNANGNASEGFLAAYKDIAAGNYRVGVKLDSEETVYTTETMSVDAQTQYTVSELVVKDDDDETTMGTVDATATGGKYYKGEKVTVKLTPAEGYSVKTTGTLTYKFLGQQVVPNAKNVTKTTAQDGTVTFSFTMPGANVDLVQLTDLFVEDMPAPAVVTKVQTAILNGGNDANHAGSNADSYTAAITNKAITLTATGLKKTTWGNPGSSGDEVTGGTTYVVGVALPQTADVTYAWGMGTKPASPEYKTVSRTQGAEGSKFVTFYFMQDNQAAWNTNKTGYISVRNEAGKTTDYTITFNVALKTYDVNVATNLTNGTVTANPAKANDGAAVTLTATPANGYVTNLVTVKNGETPIPVTLNVDGTYTFTMPAADVSVTATFTQAATIEGEIKPEVASPAVSGVDTTDMDGDTKTLADAINSAIVSGAEDITFTDTVLETAATEAVKNTKVAADDVDTAIATIDSLADTATGLEPIAAAMENAEEDTIPEAVTVVTQVYMDVAVTSVNVDNGVKEITFNITPTAQTVLTTQTNTANLTVYNGKTDTNSNANTANAIKVGTPKPIAIAAPTKVTLPLPADFATGTKLWVKHKKGSNNYFYQGKVNNAVLTFTSTNGFSPFTVYSDARGAGIVAQVGDNGYATVQEAINAVPNNGTVTLLTDTLPASDANLTIGGSTSKTVKFVLGDGVSPVTLKINGTDVEVKAGTTGGSYTYTPTSTGGGGGVSSNVTIDRPTNGKVSVTPTAPSKGATVTINLTPDTGYAVGTVTVTDKDGKAVELTKVNDNQYTFTMPDGKVTVKATFTQIETPSSTGFTDVAADAYYADAVKWAVEKGITNGLTATTFGPNNSCTRSQMVTFLWRAAGSPAATGTNSFSDVASSEYYYNAVLWAVEKGITNGTSATTFSPNATVNRGQTVTFLYRYAESPAATGTTSFTDVAADAFYADAVKWAVAEEITNGTSSTTFSPASNCTRGQIVTFMYRQMAE